MEQTKKPSLIMMCGIPGSGKSYYANEIKEKYNNVEIFSSDAIRKELFGDENCQKDGALVFATLHERIKKRLENGGNCIYDACNINYKYRMEFLMEIEAYNPYKMCFVVCEPYEVCLKQNNSRERKVPESVIERMYKNFYIPQHFEGWDKIFIVRRTKEKRTYKDLLDELCAIPHDNKHHSLSIGEHIIKTAESVFDIMDDEEDPNIVYAALLHDIGKPFTKSFVNSKGETTPEAHYYQHHLVSAYMAIPYLTEHTISFDDNVLEVLALITYHMNPYFWEKEKTAEKYRKLWGDDLYNKIMILHKADKMAH